MKENNNSEFSEQNQEHENTQYIDTEIGSTYWEMEQRQETYQTPEPAEKTKEPAYNGYNYKKPTKKPIIAAIIVVLLLIMMTATAFAFSDKIQNTLSLLTKSPKDYYAYIESQSTGNSVDKMLAIMNMSNVGENMAMESTSKLSYDKETIGAILQGNMGITIQDLEALLGIPLDSIGFNNISALEDDELYKKIGIKLNNTDIIAAEFFIDYLAKEVLIRLPDLSDAYLRQSSDNDEYSAYDINLQGYKDLLNLLKSKSTGEFIKRYTKLITDEIKDVKLTKDELLTVNNLTVETNLLTVSIYPETLINITEKILEESKNDKYIKDLLSILNISREEFDYIFEEVLEEAKYLYKIYGDDPLVHMELYVGRNGNVIGRRFSFVETGTDIFYYCLEKNNKGVYEIGINANDSTDSFKITGSHTKNNKAYTGKAILDISSQEFNIPKISFDINYEDVKTTVKNNRIYNYGRIRISSYIMNGMDLSIEYDVKDNQQLTTFKLNMGRSALVTLENSSKYIDGFKIPKPDKDAEFYDVRTEIDSYYSTLNIQEYLIGLSDRLGIDLNGMFGSFIPY